MKNIVIVLFAFVVSLWMSVALVADGDGTVGTEAPVAVSNDTVLSVAQPSPLHGHRPGCTMTYMKRVSYRKSYRTRCWFFFRCTKYRIAFRYVRSTKCCNGWVGTPGRCKVIGPCARNPCPDNSRCSENRKPYACYCNRGFQMIKGGCVDINECLRKPCPSNAICVNKPGSYYCRRCPLGFPWKMRAKRCNRMIGCGWNCHPIP